MGTRVGHQASVGAGVEIGEGAIIETGVNIGGGVIMEAGAVARIGSSVGDGAFLGEYAELSYDCSLDADEKILANEIRSEY